MAWGKQAINRTRPMRLQNSISLSILMSCTSTVYERRLTNETFVLAEYSLQNTQEEYKHTSLYEIKCLSTVCEKGQKRFHMMASLSRYCLKKTATHAEGLRNCCYVVQNLIIENIVKKILQNLPKLGGWMEDWPCASCAKSFLH